MVRIVGLVSFRIYPTHMGGQKGVALFYQHLQNYAKVILAGSNDNVPTEKADMQRILFPNKKMYRNVSRLKDLEQVVNEKSIELIIAEHSYTGWMAWMLQKRTGRPFIIHSHNIESRRFKKMNKWWWKLYHQYEGWIHRRAIHNFFISEEDRQLAIKEFRLEKEKCSVVTYGIENIEFHSDKSSLRKKLGLQKYQTILLFNGTLDYEPNYDAVITLINDIEPLLRIKLQDFLIVITGNRAPKVLAEKMLAAPNILYTGYVDDVNLYYQAADLFINPVANDTGVKTKLIEAIANNCTTVSTRAGASGIPKELCGDKLVIADSNDWNKFADMILEEVKIKRPDTPAAFYDYYNWDHITSEVAAIIKKLVGKKGGQVS